MTAITKNAWQHRLTVNPRLALLILFSVVLGLVMLIAMSIGAVSIPVMAIVQGTMTEQQAAVLTSIRIPRVLLAAMVGAALAVSGAALQGLFRNPLADPGLIGIASGAAFAVAIVIVIAGPFEGIWSLYALSFAAFTGGLLTCWLIFHFARMTGTFSVTYMLLAGIAISAIAGAGTGFLMYLSDDQQLRSLTFWTMGSLGGALWPAVIMASSVVLPCAWVLTRKAQELNIFLLGENEARYLGVNNEQLKITIIICTALSVGAAVAVSGIIGFLGLIVPHLVRLLVGADHRVLIPVSAIFGAALLVVADTFARMVVIPSEMPVGIITSLIGGPFFLWLLMKLYSGRFAI